MASNASKAKPSVTSGKSSTAISRRARYSRRRIGILQGLVKKLATKQCVLGKVLKRDTCSKRCRCNRLDTGLREELAKMQARPSGKPIVFSLDGMSFSLAGTDEIGIFFSRFGKYYGIRRFSLDNKVVMLNTAEDVAPYVDIINNLPLLEEVSFSGASLSIWASYALAEALRAKTSLRVADFSNCFAARGVAEVGPSVDALVSAILELPGVETVSLADNAFGPAIQQPLVRLLESHTPLRHLDLNNMGLGPEAGVAVAEALVRLARNKAAAAGAPPLQTLLCQRNRLVQDSDNVLFGMHEWARALAAPARRRTVDLTTNGIQLQGMDVLIAEGLARLHGLEELVLWDNTFASRGATHTALARAVPGWPLLRRLDISWSLLGSRGAALLIAALAASGDSRLESLRLSLNNLSAANTRALAAAFDRLPCLRELTLGENNMPACDAGLLALRELLEARGRERGWVTTMDEHEGSYSDTSASPTGSSSGAL